MKTLKKGLSKITPKQFQSKTDDKTEDDKEAEFDADRVIWTENPTQDLWIYLKNNHHILGLFLSDEKHPFTNTNRKVVLFSYLCACFIVAGIIAKNSHVCDEQPSHCKEQLTVLSFMLSFLGLYFLHRFLRALTKCAKIGDDLSNYNYFIGMAVRFLKSQFMLIVFGVSCILLLRGLIIFYNSGESILFTLLYIVVCMLLSSVCETLLNVWDFHSKRNIELQALAISNAAFDPYADMRGNKKRNIYVA